MEVVWKQLKPDPCQNHLLSTTSFILKVDEGHDRTVKPVHFNATLITEILLHVKNQTAFYKWSIT